MIRNLKALGLALVAVLALGAVMASGASAEKFIFDSANDNTILTGTSEGNQDFKRGLVTVRCTHAAFEGTTNAKSVNTVTVYANYTTPGCTVAGEPVHVDFTGADCAYKFTGTASTTATAELECGSTKDPNGEVTKEVTLTATLPSGESLCTIHVPPQKTTGHVFFSNVTHESVGSVTAEATVTGIKSTRTGSALCGPENNEAGTYTGNSTLTGYVDEGDVVPPFEHPATRVKVEVTD